jgi:hypothetical protein
MKIFVAESVRNHTEIELVSGKVGVFQEELSEKLFQQVENLEACDTILVPHDAFYFNKYPDYLDYLNKLSAKKPIIFSDRGDFPKNPKIDNSIALRVAINPGESSKNKIVVPYNVENLGYLPLRQYSAKPVVSFMGFMPRISPRRIIYAARQSPFHPIQGNGAMMRYISHKALVRSQLDYRFVLRKSYGALDSQNARKSRADYLKLLSDSDYVSSPRGDANQSARYFESLSAGRIPLLRNSSIQNPSSLIPHNKKIPPGLMVSTFSPNLHQIVMKEWEQFSDSRSYSRYQLEQRDYYYENLRFISFMKRMFSLDFSTFLSCAV